MISEETVLTETQAMFLGGTSKSGKSFLRSLLNGHPDLFAFAGMNLMTHDVFYRFPEWFSQSVPTDRARLVEIYKKICASRFFGFHYKMKSGLLENWWNRLEKKWQERFDPKHARFWSSGIGKILENIWLSETVQRRSLFPNLHSGRNDWYCGFGFPDHSGKGLSKGAVTEFFSILDRLPAASSEERIYRIYGEFWNALFQAFVAKQGKKYWIKESTYNMGRYAFWNRCFENTKIVYMIRDGRDVAIDRYLRYGGAISDYVDKWAKNVRKCLALQASLSPEQYRNIRYEDLVLNTKQALQEILRFFGMNYHDTMLAYPISDRHIGKHQEHWTPALDRHVRERHFDLFERLGYNLERETHVFQA